MSTIDKIELTYLKIEDHKNIVTLMNDEFSVLLSKFPKGQVGIKINGDLAGFALSIVVDYDKFDDSHTYKEITGNYSFSTHDNKGDMLYGGRCFC